MPKLDRRALLFASAIGIMTAPDVTGQTRDPGTDAEAVLRAFWDAYAAQDYDAAVSFIDPDAVRRIYEFQLTNARLAERRRVREEAREEPPAPRYPSDMPPEVVAWFEQERARERERARENRREVVFPEFLPLAELEQMSPTAFAARELRLLDPRANSGAALPQYSWTTVDVYHALMHQGAERTLVGSVVASDTLVHVLYSLHAPGKAEPWTMQSASMLLTPDGWKIWRGAEDLIGFLGSGIGESLAESAFLGPPGYDAQEVVRELFTALDERRWIDATAFIDHRVLQRFRDQAVAAARSERESREQARRSHEEWYPPDTPPEVRAWLEQQRTTNLEWTADQTSDLSNEFAGIHTIEELESLEPAELFARHLEATDLRTAFDNEVARHGVELPADEAARTARALAARRTVIGAITQSDSVVYVVYRTHRAHLPEARVPVVATVRRTEDGWRLTQAAEDPALFFTAGWAGYQAFSVMHFGFDADDDPQSAAELAATWTTREGSEARAFLTGYTGGVEPPEALTIEVTHADGTVTKLEVPASVFPTLMRMITGGPDLDRDPEH
jgi:hypothetical protein